jgi:hypothetical protein
LLENSENNFFLAFWPLKILDAKGIDCDFWNPKLVRPSGQLAQLFSSENSKN